MKKLFGSQSPEHRASPTGVVHNFYLYGPIGDSEDYVDLISILDESTEADTINLYLNTPGGDLDTAISILHAMMRTSATVVAHADGMVISAGTLIFLACENKVVYPYATFMHHDGSATGMNGSKVNETMKYISFINGQMKKMLYDIYYPYFSKEEIDMILEGKDIWLDADEMVERLEAGEEIIKAMLEDTDEGEEGEPESVLVD